MIGKEEERRQAGKERRTQAEVHKWEIAMASL